MSYTVSIHCDVTDAAALEREARRLAKACGLTDQEFDHYLKTDYADPVRFCLSWLFDHGSPLEHGVQIEQTDVDATDDNPFDPESPEGRAWEDGDRSSVTP